MTYKNEKRTPYIAGFGPPTDVAPGAVMSFNYIHSPDLPAFLVQRMVVMPEDEAPKRLEVMAFEIAGAEKLSIIPMSSVPTLALFLEYPLLNYLAGPGEAISIKLRNSTQEPVNLALALQGILLEPDDEVEAPDEAAKGPGVFESIKAAAAFVFGGGRVSDVEVAVPIFGEVLSHFFALVSEGIDLVRASILVLRERMDTDPALALARQELADHQVYDEAMSAQRSIIAEPEGEYVMALKLDKGTNHDASDGVVTIAPGQVMALVAAPYVAFRPELLRLVAEEEMPVASQSPGPAESTWLTTGEALNSLQILDIRVGRNSQLATMTPLEARFFGMTSAQRLRTDKCSPAMEYRVQLRNSGRKTVRVLGVVSGPRA